MPSLIPTMKSSLRTLLAAAATAALFLLPAAQAADFVTIQPLADQAKALPVTTAITKGEPGPDHGGPFTLTVTNASGAELKLKAVIAQSVVSHNRPKTIELPEKLLAAGAAWKIADLAADDKVTLSAAGHAKLEVKVEAAK